MQVSSNYLSESYGQRPSIPLVPIALPPHPKLNYPIYNPPQAAPVMTDLEHKQRLIQQEVMELNKNKVTLDELILKASQIKTQEKPKNRAQKVLVA